MASNSIGFAVILIVAIIGLTPLVQSVGFSIDKLTDARTNQIERSQSIQNQEITVNTNEPNPDEFTLNVSNEGLNEVEAIGLTVLFENTNASILSSFEFKGSTYTVDTAEIDGDPVPNNRTVIPPSKQLNITYSKPAGSDTPDQVRVFTRNGIGDTDE